MEWEATPHNMPGRFHTSTYGFDDNTTESPKMCAARAETSSSTQAASAASHAVSEAMLTALQQQPQKRQLPVRLGVVGMVLCPHCGKLLARERNLERHEKSCAVLKPKPEHKRGASEARHTEPHGRFILLVLFQCLNCKKPFSVETEKEFSDSTHPCPNCGSTHVKIRVL